MRGSRPLHKYRRCIFIRNSRSRGKFLFDSRFEDVGIDLRERYWFDRLDWLDGYRLVNADVLGLLGLAKDSL